jgi:hypothetical protein
VLLVTQVIHVLSRNFHFENKGAVVEVRASPHYGEIEDSEKVVLKFGDIKINHGSAKCSSCGHTKNWENIRKPN